MPDGTLTFRSLADKKVRTPDGLPIGTVENLIADAQTEDAYLMVTRATKESVTKTAALLGIAFVTPVWDVFTPTIAMQTWSQKAFIPFRYVKSVAEEVIVDVSEAPKNMSLPETYDCILGGEGSILSFRGIKGLYGGEVAAPQVWKVAFTGCLGAPIMSMDRKKLLGTIYDYVIDIMTCKRIGLIFEERKIFGPKKKFFIPMNKIMRQKEKVFTYFLINLEDAKPL